MQKNRRRKVRRDLALSLHGLSLIFVRRVQLRPHHSYSLDGRPYHYTTFDYQPSPCVFAIGICIPSLSMLHWRSSRLATPARRLCRCLRRFVMAFGSTITDDERAITTACNEISWRFHIRMQIPSSIELVGICRFSCRLGEKDLQR